MRIAVALSLATADELALFNDRLELQRGRDAELNWLGSSLDDWMDPILNTRLPCAAALERVHLYAMDADDSVESMQAAVAAAGGNPAFVSVTAATLTAVTQWRDTVHAMEAAQELAVTAAREAQKVAHTAALAKVSMAKKIVGNAAVEQELALPGSAERRELGVAAVEGEVEWKRAVKATVRGVLTDVAHLDFGLFVAHDPAPALVDDGPAVGGGGGPAIWADDVEATMARLISGYLTPAPTSVYGLEFKHEDPEEHNMPLPEQKLYRKLLDAEAALIRVVVDLYMLEEDVLEWLSEGNLKRRCGCDDVSIWRWVVG